MCQGIGITFLNSGASILGVGVATPRFWAGVVGVVDGSRNIIISYHVQEVCSKVVNFEEK